MKYLVLLAFLVGCSDTKITMDGVFRSPEFKAGDCAISTRDLRNQNEFLPNNNDDIEKIIKVGKRNYLFEFGPFGLQAEFPISSYDRIMTKVNCPKGK